MRNDFVSLIFFEGSFSQLENRLTGDELLGGVIGVFLLRRYCDLKFYGIEAAVKVDKADWVLSLPTGTSVC